MLSFAKKHLFFLGGLLDGLDSHLPFLLGSTVTDLLSMPRLERVIKFRHPLTQFNPSQTGSIFHIPFVWYISSGPKTRWLLHASSYNPHRCQVWSNHGKVPIPKAHLGLVWPATEVSHPPGQALRYGGHASGSHGQVVQSNVLFGFRMHLSKTELINQMRPWPEHTLRIHLWKRK